MAEVAENAQEERKLTPRQRVFVEEYLRCWNASEAARRAGYSDKTAYSIGSENLRKPEIQTEVQRRISETAMSADEVLLRLAQHARGDFSPFLTADGAIDLTTERARANIGLLKKVKVKERILIVDKEPVKEIETEIELYDSQAALVHLGKHHKLFTESVEFGGQVAVKGYVGFTPDDEWNKEPES